MNKNSSFPLNEKEYKNWCEKKHLSGFNIKVPIAIQTFHDFEERRDFYATEFAEGNDNLKELLLFLWDKGIETNACCRGHKSNEAMPESSYISISLGNISVTFLKSLFKNLFQTYGDRTQIIYFDEDLGKKIVFYYHHAKEDTEKIIIQNSKRFFQSLYDQFKNVVFDKVSDGYEERLYKDLLLCTESPIKVGFLPLNRVWFTGYINFYLTGDKAKRHFPQFKDKIEDLIAGKIKNFSFAVHKK